MKKTILLILLLINSFLFSQTKKIIVVDSLTKENIQYVNVKYIESQKGTFTDSLGYFSLNKKLSDRILVSVLGYENKIYNVKEIKDSIFLKPEVVTLDEILLKKKSIKKYGLHLKKGKFMGSSVKRAVIAMYIENEEKNIQSIISKLHFRIKKRKGNFPSIVRPHLYTINKKTKLPEKELLNYNILIKENKKRKGIISIDVSDKSILFPKEGVFVALEWVGNTEDIDFGYQEVKENTLNRTLLTSLNFKKRIWVPIILPKKNKNISANFGITTIEIQD